MRALMLITVLLALAGCGESVASELVVVEGPSHELDLYGLHGVATLDEMIATSPVIVRGRLASVRTVGVRSVFPVTVIEQGQERQLDGYVGSVELTFDVIEYLKGLGGAQVKGIAYGYPITGRHTVRAATREEAAELAHRLLDGRDKRWDDREAIVFLREPPIYFVGPHGDHYWLGELEVYEGSNRQVTVASDEARAWLPDASPSATSTVARQGDAGGDAENPDAEQRFLLEDPVDISGGVSGSSPDSAEAPAAESITLSTLKAKIAAFEAEIAASSAPEAYRRCIAATHEFNRLTQNARYNPLYETFPSGLAAGTVVYPYGDAVQYATTTAQVWLEGRDAHLFEERRSTGKVHARRPLPAGEYRAFLFWRSPEMVICDGQPDALRDVYVHVFTVTAPEGTLAEALFDPVADGDAFSAATTVGTIGWESGEVTATLNQDVTGHVLDFIVLDGAVSLSLAAASATSTDGTLSWAVPDQPWEDGDQLMVRIRVQQP